ncbi:hypothetical protein LR48_Vigan07g124600 [Vigna angularis]|uniref:Uncharacterized protein n=1 Tax=Phaseolus angularis TaxID=3914 RepID=A0A0L9UY87_PHAAN|nr:hypothetical protein LR48_Vigan07g124600 [Vigna angularis]
MLDDTLMMMDAEMCTLYAYADHRAPKIISERIDSLVEQSSQGQFTPKGRQDILTTTIGQPEHLGRVRVGGTRVGIQDYFGSSSRQTSYAYNEAQEQRLTQEITKKLRADLREELRTELRIELREELYNEVTTEVTDRVMRQFQQQFKSYGMHPLPFPVQEQEHVVPPTGRNGKGSCSAPVVLGDDMDDASPYLLYILEGTGTMLVARGTVFQASTVVHGMELFSLWHRHSSLLSLGRNTWLTHAQEKICLSEDDPLGALQQLADIIANKPLEVEYDANVFGRGSEVPISTSMMLVGRSIANIRKLAWIGLKVPTESDPFTQIKLKQRMRFEVIASFGYVQNDEGVWVPKDNAPNQQRECGQNEDNQQTTSSTTLNDVINRIEQLQTFVGTRFDAFETRFRHMDMGKRFDALESRVRNIQEQLHYLHNRFDE